MKKLILLLFLFIIKLNAYEYLYIEYHSNEPSTSTNAKEGFYSDEKGNLMIKYYRFNGNFYFQSVNYDTLNSSRMHLSNQFRTIYDIKKYYENDLIFLNDLYTKTTNQFLNYLYNENNFSNSNYIQYDDYELLYNYDGLVIESIVNGTWAGLYSESEKSSSGYLYDSGGTLIYYNGEKVNWIQSTIDKIIHHVMDNLYTLVHIISTPVGVCVSFVFVLCLAYYVVEVGRRAIKPIDDNIRKRNLNE